MAAPLNLPPFPVRKRLVSGRYRGRTGGYELELRVDVDGTTALSKVSGDYSSVLGNTVTYFGSWQVIAPAVVITPSTVSIEGLLEAGLEAGERWFSSNDCEVGVLTR